MLLKNVQYMNVFFILFKFLGGICPPPPYLQDGDYSIISTEKGVITEVSYTCQSYYVLDKQQESYKCVDRKWETPPKCLSESFNYKLILFRFFVKTNL